MKNLKFDFGIKVVALFFLNHDAAAVEDGGRIAAVTRSKLIVIHDLAGGFVPNFDAEFVRATAAADLSVSYGVQPGVKRPLLY